MHASAQTATQARWKLWILRWASLYPTVYLISLLLGVSNLHLATEVRILVTTGLGSLLMTYVLMPCMTRRFAAWLSR